MKPQINKHKGKCVSFTDVGVRMYIYIYVYQYTYETCTYRILYTYIHIHTLFYLFACDYEAIWNKYSIRLLLCDWGNGGVWGAVGSFVSRFPRVTLKHHDSFSDGWRALKRAGFAFRIRMMMRVCSTPAAARHQFIDDVWILGHLLSIIDVFFSKHVYSSLIHPKWGICNMFNFWQTPLSLQIQGFLENIWNESCQLNTLRSLPISLSYRSRCWRVHSSLGLLLRGWEKYENKLCPVLGSVVVDSSQWPSDDLKHSYIYICVVPSAKQKAPKIIFHR